MSAARTYELVYIITPEATEQQVADLHGLVQGIVERFSGELQKTENWGRKKLAYEIGRHKEGIYVLEQIQGPPDLIKELDRRLKVTDQVIRHLTVRVDDEMLVAERRRSERLAERARRRAARGLPVESEPEAGGAESGPRAEEQQAGQAEAQS